MSEENINIKPRLPSLHVLDSMLLIALVTATFETKPKQFT